MKFEEYNEDNGRAQFGVNIEDSLSKLSAVQSVVLASDLEKESVPELAEASKSLMAKSKLMKDFVESAMGDKSETVMKKLSAAAFVVAKNKGVFPAINAIDPIRLASTASIGATQVKTAYKVATGEMEINEAADALIDEAAVRIPTIADKVIDKYGPKAINVISAALSKHPYTAVLATAIKAYEKPILTATKVVVRKGIKHVANAAKNVVHKAIPMVKNVANKVMNLLTR